MQKIRIVKDYLVIFAKPESVLDEFIYKGFILGKFIEDLDEILTEYDSKSVQGIKNIIANYIFAQHGEPDFADTSYLKKIGEKNLSAILALHNSLHTLYPNKDLAIEIRRASAYKSRYNIPFVRPRRTLYPEVSELEIFRVNVFYHALKQISPGRQWTLLSNAETQTIRDEGYGIECFGSTLNSRLQYFGSLNAVDEPFGRLGTYEEILEKFANNEPITYRGIVVNCNKITVNPPSTKFQVYHAFELICKVLKNHEKPIEIIYHAPKYLSKGKFHEADNWLISKTELVKAYDDTGRVISLKDREWVEFRFSKN